MPTFPHYAPGDQVVERAPHYLLGPRVAVIGTIVGRHENGEDYWVTGLRVPDRDKRGRYDWEDPYLFGVEELRPRRARADKAYFLQRSDLLFLREKFPVEPPESSASTQTAAVA